MRKILYSSRYGHGWSSTNTDNKDQQRFMCEYQPFIQYIEMHGEMPQIKKIGWADEYETTDLGMMFIRDWKAQFPDAHIPSLYGMKHLKIFYVEDGEQYCINSYDGKESVVTRSEMEDEWL